MTCHLRALALRPDFALAQTNLGIARQEEGDPDAAIDCYRAALDIEPEYCEARWALAMAQIPAVYSADQDPRAVRDSFAAALANLDQWFGPRRIADGVRVVGNQQPFHLAYQDIDDTALLARYGALCGRLMAHWQREQGYRPGPVGQGGRIRVGIVSAHICDHSVWNALIKGWMLHLDRRRFELHVFHLGKTQGRETALARSLANSFVDGRGALPQWAESILAQGIDVLVYPEIGMDPMTAKLANLRLAAVQVAAWGHPETTGLPTMDYYVSAQDLEGEGAEGHYTEKLVRLPHLGCCWRPLAVTATASDIIAPDRPLLLCPGAPFKYAPPSDGVLVDIARRLGRCRLVFFTQPAQAGLCFRLRRRLEQAFRGAGLDFDDYGVFIPWLDRPAFYGLMQRADLCLDTIGFSGFNTAMQAVECALPVVTRKGRFLRGRLASGILQRIGLAELVAETDEDYVGTAVRLASDGGYREMIRTRITASRAILMDDREPIRAFEEFLVAALGKPPS